MTMMKRFFRILSCMLALVMLVSLPGAFAASSAADIPGYVVANTMPVYQYPHLLSAVLGTMSYGESVLVLSWQDGWFRVQNIKGEIGYCPYGGLSPVNPALDIYGYVKENGAYVFAKPGLGYKVIAQVTMGKEVHVVGMTRDKTWLRLKNGDTYGYVLTELISKTPTWFSNGRIAPD